MPYKNCALFQIGTKRDKGVRKRTDGTKLEIASVALPPNWARQLQCEIFVGGRLATNGKATAAMYEVSGNKVRRSRGFTLLELLVVIVIIGLLAAYVGPKYFAQLGKSEVTIARAQINALETSLDTFRLDVGRYPTTEEGLAALVNAPAALAAKWYGPYLSERLI